MNQGDDQSLLDAYVQTQSQQAFETLAGRYINLVYTAARRQARDEHLAYDITQAVFLILMRKAHTLRNTRTLAGWLLNTTHFAARDALRTQSRRRRHETRAASMKPTSAQSDDDARSEQLDHALAQLSDDDRSAIALRYFEGLSLSEVAAALGITTDAATKRTHRALDRLRHRFAADHVSLTAAAIETLIRSNATIPAPPGLAASLTAPSQLAKTLATARFNWLKPLVIGSATGLVAIGLWIGLHRRGAPPAVAAFATAPTTMRTATSRPLNESVIAVRDALLDRFPIPKPWPLQLPGEVCGTPILADVEGAGHPQIIVTSKARSSNLAAHPDPNPAPLLFAIRFDGSVVPGWPVNLSAPGATPQARSGATWASSPSVFRRNGRDNLVVTGPTGGLRIVSSDASVRFIPGGVERINVPLADLDGDSMPDIIDGQNQCNVDGRRISTWPESRKLRNGFCPCVGDAMGNGQLELFHLFYGGAVSNVGGFDQQGNPLPGWPQKVTGVSFLPPVMGDIDGDGKMEVVAAYGDSIFAWKADGKPLPCDHAQGPAKGVFQSGINACAASPTLADLDGDGKAEIIVFDANTSSLRAWHGDGKPFIGDDGVIAKLPMQYYGISAVGPDSAGDIHFFTGVYWIKLHKDKSTEIIPMLPNDPPINLCQPTCGDMNDDGKLDVIFGTADGRVVVYQTGIVMQNLPMQWPTANHDFQHTGCWKPPTK